MRETCRPSVLNVKVGSSGRRLRISPYGRSPNLISAWKPLQMPSISPSRCFSKSSTSAATRGLRNVVAMNLPEPAGSSPPEKPPGSITIWLSRMPRASASIVSSMSFGERFLTTSTFGSAPAFANAFAVSYSQFVPGNTGIKTRGFAAFTAGAWERRS